MPNLSLDDLQRQLGQKDAELQALRQELEARQQRLDALAQRKQTLQDQLRQVETEMAAVTAGKQEPPAAGASTSEPTFAPRATPARPAKQSLPNLLVAVLREAGRPLTVAELAAEARRRGFRSNSKSFPKLVKNRAYELKDKGVLRRAADGTGFVLAGPGGGLTPQGAGAVKPSAKPANAKPPANQAKQAGMTANGKAAAASKGKPAPRAKATKQAPLREVLVQILRKSTTPLTGGELAERALAAGYQTKSRNLADVVWVVVRKMDNVEHVPGKGYRLRRAQG